MTGEAQNLGTAIPSFLEIEAAAQRVEAMCEETPLFECPTLNARLKGRLLVKAEGLQKTGSFKMRGAFNRLSMLTEDERRRGVVAVSSGNHGRAVAHAAKTLGTTAIVVMPTDAPKIKIEGISALGAKVVLHDRAKGDLEGVGRELAKKQDMVLVPRRTIRPSWRVPAPWDGRSLIRPPAWARSSTRSSSVAGAAV